MNETTHIEGPVCPMPLQHSEQIVIGHGSGGRMTADLIRRVFLPRFENPPLDAGNDSAKVGLPDAAQLKGRLAISTDCHIVTPLFFPGGDIGRLAVSGTVNDVAMSGATPLYLTAGFILEEGLSMEVLERVVHSMQAAADEAGVQIVAGDTKVVEKGKADGLFITTAGVGYVPEGKQIGGEMAQPGDVVLISGTLGEHGIAVLGARGELGFETELESDVAPLNRLIAEVLEAAPHTHVLRDPNSRRPGNHLERDCRTEWCGHPAGREEYPSAAGGARGVRDAGLRPAVRGQRGQGDCDRARRGSRGSLGGHAPEFARQDGYTHRDGAGAARRACPAAHGDWGNPDFGCAGGRDAAEDLLGKRGRTAVPGERAHGSAPLRLGWETTTGAR